jgi:hypothetical protein
VADQGFRDRYFECEQIATALYRAILGREPDRAGLLHYSDALRSGHSLEQVINSFLQSQEFRAHAFRLRKPSNCLPNLTEILPDLYEKQGDPVTPWTVFVARSDQDFCLMESLFQKHRYYDDGGVWSPVIDLDKKITAAIVTGLGAQSCFELGCFTGPVISLLADAGVDVLGTDISHDAFTFAYQNIRRAMVFGDILSLQIDRRFDVILCMDVLEHLNPIKLGTYICCLLSLLRADGYIYINSPMFGRDEVFGIQADPYLTEWQAVGDTNYWRHIHCDELGWPVHGHLVWASPIWWTRQFREHGLVRDETIEKTIHKLLGSFFDAAPGRRSLFVLRTPDSRRSSQADAESVSVALAGVLGL